MGPQAANTTLGTVKVTAAATASHSMFIVFSKETAFPTAELWTGVETERLFFWCPGLLLLLLKGRSKPVCSVNCS